MSPRAARRKKLSLVISVLRLLHKWRKRKKKKIHTRMVFRPEPISQGNRFHSREIYLSVANSQSFLLLVLPWLAVLHWVYTVTLLYYTTLLINKKMANVNVSMIFCVLNIIAGLLAIIISIINLVEWHPYFQSIIIQLYIM